MKRNTYPPEFIAALLDTAERANIKDADAPRVLERMAEFSLEPPSPQGNLEMMELVAKLCWIINEAGGWFYGAGGQY